MPGTRRSGRRPTPTAILKARGSKLRPKHKAEPTAPVGVPRRPIHLDADPDAAAIWDTLASRLLDQKVLTTAHGELLAVLADAWAQYVRLKKAFAEGGYQAVLTSVWTDENGNPRSRVIDNPLARQLRQQALLLNALLGEFGQTPASASKVAAQVDTPDPFDRFLQGPAPAPGSSSSVVPFSRRRKESARHA